MKRNEKMKGRKLEGGKLDQKQKQAGGKNEMIMKLAIIAIMLMKCVNGFVVRTGDVSFGRRRPEMRDDLRRVAIFDGSEVSEFGVEIETMKIFGDVENVKNIIVEKETLGKENQRMKESGYRHSKANR